MAKCEGCKEEKEVIEIEGHLLCKDCKEDIVECDFCHKFLGINYDALMVGNFGKLSVPTLSLPDMMTDAVFCNIEHLEGYLKKYKDMNKGHKCKC